MKARHTRPSYTERRITVPPLLAQVQRVWDLTDEEMADEFGVSTGRYRSWLNGQHAPRTKALYEATMERGHALLAGIVTPTARKLRADPRPPQYEPVTHFSMDSHDDHTVSALLIGLSIGVVITLIFFASLSVV